jgi:hypothetical protein
MTAVRVAAGLILGLSVLVGRNVRGDEVPLEPAGYRTSDY